jgi:hypothetical protein
MFIYNIEVQHYTIYKEASKDVQHCTILCTVPFSTLPKLRDTVQYLSMMYMSFNIEHNILMVRIEDDGPSPNRASPQAAALEEISGPTARVLSARPTVGVEPAPHSGPRGCCRGASGAGPAAGA